MRIRNVIFAALSAISLFAGCRGYTNQSLYTDSVQSIFVEMFDNTTFQRDLEYDLTNAIAKRINAETPYRIVSDKSRADTVLSGKITNISSAALTLERETGRPWKIRRRLQQYSVGKILRQASILLKTSRPLRRRHIRSFSSRDSITPPKRRQTNWPKES
jgi:hypothetical protein